MASNAHDMDRSVTLPDGVTPAEALFVLRLLARLKLKRFGRLRIAVADGRVVDIEVAEKVDRNVLRTV
jgi:hypothetical protein